MCYLYFISYLAKQDIRVWGESGAFHEFAPYLLGCSSQLQPSWNVELNKNVLKVFYESMLDAASRFCSLMSSS